MSVLRRVLRAANELRDQIDLDAVRDAVGASGSRRPDGFAAAATGAPTDDERRAADRARALGAPDPYALVTAAEAEAALGAPAGPPRLTYGDDTIGVIRAAGSGSLSVSVFHAADTDSGPFDAAAHWHGFLAPVVVDDAAEIAGVGRAALRTAGGLYVLGDDALLYLTLTRPDGASADAPLAELARTVLARLAPRD
jgi:hypothetical protein